MAQRPKTWPQNAPATGPSATDRQVVLDHGHARPNKHASSTWRRPSLVGFQAVLIRGT